jgi:hypothetical protein
MPYAAKATIEHEYIVDLVMLWVTFRHPMNITVTPDISKWTVTADGTDYDVVSQVWLDEFTLTLTSDTIAARPASVSLTYTGPDVNLKTTWDKQWEPWGAIPSTDLTATLWQTGMIILWSGTIASIPSGFALCDGNNGTPNLGDRFVFGANPTAIPGTTGGSLGHTHTATQPTHTHTPPPGMGFAFGTFMSSNFPTAQPAITVNPTDNLPPYYVLAYIMKL